VTTVLFTCSGQRVDVLLAFRRAGAEVVAADLNPDAPTLFHADVALSPPSVSDPDYLGFVASAVQDHGVSLVVPLTDLDQLILARGRGELGTATVLLPKPEAIELTRDKYAAHRFFLEHGFGSPETWLPDELPDELPWPVLVKSRYGFGSRDIHLARDREELDFFLGYTQVPSMVQRVCAGEEFSIDVFCDLEARCLNAVPRTMIESKGGESIKGRTIADRPLIELGRDVAEALRIIGPATIQCYRDESGRHELTDVNARFGGAFPLPLAAGGDYPALALALARGEWPEPRVGEFQEGVLMTRFFWQVCVDTAGEEVPAAPAEALSEIGTVGRP
jgi:carbamoyl-phosphate synthase large subunit